MLGASGTGYRRTDLDAGREAAFLARALEIAAHCVERPVSAVDALRVAELEACSPQPRRWAEAAGSAARALSLQPHARDASARDLLEPGASPALGRGRRGEWLLVRGRRGRRLLVTVIDAYGERTRLMRPARLDRLTNGACPWIGFEPLLALDPIARREPQPDARRIWSRLRAFLRLERRELWIVLVYAVVIGGMTLATPIAVQALVNTIAMGAVLQPLVVLSLMLLAGLTFSGLLQVLEAFVVEVIQRRAFVRVAEDFGRRLPGVDASVYARSYLPERVNRFFDVLTVQKSLATLLLDGLSLALQAAIGLMLLAFYHPLLLAFGGVLMVLLGIVIWAGRGASRTALLESRAKYATAAWLEDVARLPTLFRGARAAQHAAQHTEMLCRDYLNARRRHYRILLRQIAGGLGLQVLATVSLLGVGGWLVMERQLTLGQLVAAELVIGAVAAGFAKLGKNLEKAYDLAIGVDKIGTVVDLASERRGGEAPEAAGPAGLALRDLKVTRGGRTIVQGVELDIAPGSRVLVRGRAASGKSTVLDVLAGLSMADAGAVLVDGLDLRRADLGLVRDQVVLVRGVELLVGSVIDNLRTSAGTLSETQARALLEHVGLAEAVDGLPEGLGTALVPSGAPLSGSQARRLVLARALAARPRALVLDGALDGLGLSDEEHDALMRRVLGPDAPWTAVVVSDDPRVASWCDRQVCLEQGRVEEVQ